MQNFNRAEQRRLLEELRDAYPLELDFKEDVGTDDANGVARNLTYLAELGLVEALIQRYDDGGYSLVRAKLHARGIDFLMDDGGMSAILGTVTVRFHEDTLKALIEAKLESADMPAPDKKRWLDALRALPGESIKHLATKLIDAGLQHAPDALPLVHKFLFPHSG